MIVVQDLNQDTIAFELSGVVTGDEYEKVLIPALERKLQKVEKINVLYHVTNDFESYELKAMLDDAKAGLEFLGNWNKIAVVSDVEWIVQGVKLFAFLMPGRIRTFSNDALEDAKKWLLEKEEPKPSLDVEIDVENKIAILKPNAPLSEEDFLRARSIIDPFIETNGDLKGLIIYTKEFPWWDSFGALMKHLKFIKEHHKHVKKLAYVTDSFVGEMAQKAGSHFVSAEVKNFDFTQLKEAKEWILS